MDLLSTQPGEPGASELAAAHITPHQLAGHFWRRPRRCFWFLPRPDFGTARGLQALADGTNLPGLVPIGSHRDALRSQGTTATIGDLGGITNTQVPIAQR